MSWNHLQRVTTVHHNRISLCMKNKSVNDLIDVLYTQMPSYLVINTEKYTIESITLAASVSKNFKSAHRLNHNLSLDNFLLCLKAETSVEEAKKRFSAWAQTHVYEPITYTIEIFIGDSFSCPNEVISPIWYFDTELKDIKLDPHFIYQNVHWSHFSSSKRTFSGSRSFKHRFKYRHHIECMELESSICRELSFERSLLQNQEDFVSTKRVQMSEELESKLVWKDKIKNEFGLKNSKQVKSTIVKDFVNRQKKNLPLLENNLYMEDINLVYKTGMTVNEILKLVDFDDTDYIEDKDLCIFDNTYGCSFEGCLEQIKNSTLFGLGFPSVHEPDQTGIDEDLCMRFSALICSMDGYKKYFDPVSIEMFSLLGEGFNIRRWTVRKWPFNTFIGSCKIHFIGAYNGEEPVYSLVPNGSLQYIKWLEKEWLSRFSPTFGPTLQDNVLARIRLNHQYLENNNRRYNLNTYLMNWLDHATYEQKKRINFATIKTYLQECNMTQRDIQQERTYIHTWLSEVTPTYEEALDNEFDQPVTHENVREWLYEQGYMDISFEEINEYVEKKRAEFLAIMCMYSGPVEEDSIVLYLAEEATLFRSFMDEFITSNLERRARQVIEENLELRSIMVPSKLRDCLLQRNDFAREEVNRLISFSHSMVEELHGEHVRGLRLLRSQIMEVMTDLMHHPEEEQKMTIQVIFELPDTTMNELDEWFGIFMPSLYIEPEPAILSTDVSESEPDDEE
jgi:hypothetical protein